MRWMLLLVGIALHTAVIGQATLKIYVVNDDTRSDMDIIDLNTSAMDRYGKSVDSTNINFYTTTMSTQVMRMSRLELFGPEEEKVQELTQDVETTKDLVQGGNSIGPIDEVEKAAILNKEKATSSKTNNAIASRSESRSSKPRTAYRASKTKKRHGHVKKSRKMKKYKGQCPRFF